MHLCPLHVIALVHRYLAHTMKLAMLLVEAHPGDTPRKLVAAADVPMPPPSPPPPSPSTAGTTTAHKPPGIGLGESFFEDLALGKIQRLG